MWRRRRLPLSSQLFGVLALVLGTAAFSIVRSAQERYETLLPAAGPAVRLVVAAAPIPRGAVVQDGWIEVRQVPRAFAAPGWIGSPADVVGRVLAADVVAGEPIIRARLAPSGAGPLAAQVPDGLRAVALPVAVPPGLEAGDRVDVLATFVERGYTEPVGAGLEVVRVGAGADPAELGGTPSVVVLTTPEGALRLATAAAVARLTLSVVGPDEHELPLPPPSPG